ncbi:MAG: hypothetical protein JNL58_18750 [Planctomyces sp.]|nr:hypothetical protein [Planctomyces sp.]
MTSAAKSSRSAHRKLDSKLKVTYRCGFCRDPLMPAPLKGIGWVLAIFGIRDHFCPHCFQLKPRPWGWLKVVLWPVFMVMKFFKALRDR